MSPKTATISMALIILSLSVALSSASPSQKFVNPSQVLTHYGLPAGLFPDDVVNFQVKPIGNDGKQVKLTLTLSKACNVTRTAPPLFKPRVDTVECQKEISAIVSQYHLTQVKGVKVYALVPKGVPTMEVSEVVVTFGFFHYEWFFLPVPMWLVQFKSYEQNASPAFPRSFIEQYPKCDSKLTLDYNGMLSLSGEEMAQEYFARGFNYGRPLLLEA